MSWLVCFVALVSLAAAIPSTMGTGPVNQIPETSDLLHVGTDICGSSYSIKTCLFTPTTCPLGFIPTACKGPLIGLKDPVCEECPLGYYDGADRSKEVCSYCSKCIECQPDEEVLVPCTSTHDAVCRKKENLCGLDGLIVDGCSFTSTTCTAGQYAAKCALDLVTPENPTKGSLSLQISRRSVCMDCPAGYFHPVNDNRTICNYCEACARNSISQAGATSCSLCLHGHTNDTAASSCECDVVDGVQWVNDIDGNCRFPPKDGEGMACSGIEVEDPPVENDFAGAPGTESPEFPEDLGFAQPCAQMEDEETIKVLKSLLPPPMPTPTPQLYPDDTHIAWEIVSVIREINALGKCNFSREGLFSLGGSIWKALPFVNSQNNTCPQFLKANPLFPETPTPTPPPSDLLREEKEKVEKLRQMIDHAESQGNTDEVLRLKEKIDATTTKAQSRVTAKEEMSSYRPVMFPQPLVPEECGDDLTGSNGFTNSDVVGTTSGMNRNFHPLPSIYSPRGNREPLAFRERLIGARPARFEMLALETEEGLTVTGNGCTLYQGLSLSALSPPSSSLSSPLHSDCERACLFDDECQAWVWVRHPGHKQGNREEQNCHLYNEEKPNLIESSEDGIITGLCPKSKLCPQPSLQKILSSTHSEPAKAVGCPKLLSDVMDGVRLDLNEHCGCIRFLNSQNNEKNDLSCLLSPVSLPWSAVLALCSGPTVVEVNMVQSNIRDCSGTAYFDAGAGGCSTYSSTVENSNFLHCSTDFDKKLRRYAVDTCWQCGKCQATPTPTPYIPFPSLHTGFELDNGDTTPCLDARKSAVEKAQTGPLAGWYTPTCYADGSFTPTQCFENECWCVYENGVEIPETRFESSMKDSFNHPKCRPEPTMGMVYPHIPVIIPDRRRVAIRELAKLLYALVQPELICRPGDTRTLERVITEVLETHRLHNSTKPACPPPSRSPSLPLVLSHLTSLLLSPILHRDSPSPSPSFSPSRSPSSSLSPSPSPSTPIPMCGSISCADLGIPIHIYTHPRPGDCSMCVEGTSGPCRDGVYVCSAYQYGSECGVGKMRCADVSGEGLPANGQRADPACVDRVENYYILTANFSIATTTTPGLEYSMIVASSIADILSLGNLCDIVIDWREKSDVIGRAVVIVTVAADTLEEGNIDLTALSLSVSDGSLLKSLLRRGFPGLDSRIILQSANVTQYRPSEHILPAPRSRAIILDSSHSNVLLSKDKGNRIWGSPGGHIEKGEAPEVALWREVREETNLSQSDFSTWKQLTYDEVTNTWWYLLVLQPTPTSTITFIHDPDEATVELKFFPTNNLPEVFPDSKLLISRAGQMVSA